MITIGFYLGWVSFLAGMIYNQPKLAMLGLASVVATKQNKN